MPIQDLFGYQPPNDDTKIRFNRLDEVYASVRNLFVVILAHRVDTNALMASAIPRATKEQFEPITEACRAFADEMKLVCPPSADQTAAVRNIRLARMYANEALLQRDRSSPRRDYDQALEQLKMAWFQAKASVALALPEELPPLEVTTT